jgi:hypothetical protein
MRDIKNPIVEAVFRIIHRDAQNHRQVQEMIIQGHEKAGFVLTVDQMEMLSKVVARHVRVEKQMIEAADESLKLIAGKKHILHEYFLKYLQEDEKKHMDLLKGLEDLKRNMHPYGPAA